VVAGQLVAMMSIWIENVASVMDACISWATRDWAVVSSVVTFDIYQLSIADGPVLSAA